MVGRWEPQTGGPARTNASILYRRLRMNNIIAIAIMLVLIGLISRTERHYMILWAFATPVFYIIFGFKSFYISLGLTDVELFSGVLPIVVCIMAWQKLTPTEKRRAWKYSPKLWWLFLAYYFSSLAWSDNVGTGTRTVLELALPSFLYLIAFNVIQNDFHLERYYKWMMALNITVAIFDLYNAYTGWSVIHDAGAMTEGAVGYRTVTAYFYVTMAMILMMRMMDKFQWKIFSLFVVDLFLILVSGSRTPTYAFIAGSFIAVLYRRNVRFTILGVVGLALLAGILWILPTHSKF